MNCKLVIPNKKHKLEWIEYAKEYISDNPSLKPLEYTLDMNFDKWLESISNESEGKNIEKGRVQSTKFFLVNNDGRIIGGISIRHNINNDFLFNYGGHIGYGIRPSERNKGYGSMILQLGLKEAKKLGIKKVLITCLNDNVFSRKVIEKNGGILENMVQYDSGVMRRYWIDLRGENNE